MGHLNDGTLVGQWVCSDDGLGAGGFLSTVDQALDGSMTTHADSTSPFYRHPDSGRWKRFLRVGDGSNGQDDNYNGSTVGLISDISSGITLARSNGQVMAAIISGTLFRTTTGAEGVNSVERLTVPQLPGGWWQSLGSLVEIDPNNPNVWWFATPDGLLISDDMFDTWDTVSLSDVPAAPSDVAELGHYQKPKVLFDRTSLSGGKSQVGYVMVPGNRIRKTTDAGATWSEVPVGPPVTYVDGGGATRSYYYHMAVDPHTGDLHVCQYAGNGGPHWRLRSGTWSTSGQTGVRPVIDPHNAGRIYLPTTGSNLTYSIDDGATWASGGLAMMTQTADRIRWFNNTNQAYMAHGQMIFDEVEEGRAWLAEGIGLWRCDAFPASPSTSNVIDWIEDSYGIENMTMKVGNVGPDGTEGWAFWDRTGCVTARDEIGQFPRSNGPLTPDYHAVNPMGGGSADWAFDDHDFWVLTSVSYSPEIGGWSRKPFASWTAFESDITYFAQGEHTLFTGSVSGTTLTVASVESGSIQVGHTFISAVPSDPLDGVRVTALGTGSGGVGTYTLSEARTVAGPRAMHLVEYGGQSGGGNIAALSTNVFIQQQGGGGHMMYTEDRGATWHHMFPFFGPNFHTGNSFINHNLERKTLVKDAYHANTAFFVHPGILEEGSLGGPLDLGSRGVWKIVYNGPGSTPRFTCTRQRNTALSGFGSDSWNAKLVQYGDGHWLYTSGPDYHLLWESTDDGVTWTSVTGTDNINGDWGGDPLGGHFGPVYAVAVGRGALPGDPKTVFVIGHRPPDGMNHYNVISDALYHQYYGTWLCRNFTDPDADRVWERVVKHPNGMLGGFYGRISDIVGSPVGYGEFSVGNGAGGVFRMRHLDRRRASAGALTPTIALSSNLSVSEGNSGTSTVTTTVTVTRNGVTGALVVDLTYGGTATSGTDYATPPTSVTILSGQNTADFDITLNGDTTVEGDETIIVNAALAAYPSATASRTITATNDDSAPAADILPIAEAVGYYTAPGSGVTTGAIDTTGADCLIASVNGYAPSMDAADLEDSKGNTWTPLTRHTTSDDVGALQDFICLNPTVGTGHTVTLSGADLYGTVHFTAWSGVKQVSPVDAEIEVDVSTGVSPTNIGPVTPSQDGTLFLSHIMPVGGGAPTPDFTGTPDFTILHSRLGPGGQTFTSALAYHVQETAAALTGQWSWGVGAGNTVISLLALKPA